MNPEKYISYDKGADVLYVSFFDPPREAVGEEVVAGIVIRRDIDSKEIVGVTILDLRERFID